MAAVTTLPGTGIRLAERRRFAPRDATPRGRRPSRASSRRRRLTAALCVLGAVVVTGEAGVALGGTPLAAPERRPATPGPSVVVRPRDTLWSIVSRAHPDGDPRPIVDELSDARHGEPLQPGETIRVPR